MHYDISSHENVFWFNSKENRKPNITKVKPRPLYEATQAKILTFAFQESDASGGDGALQ